MSIEHQRFLQHVDIAPVRPSPGDGLRWDGKNWVLFNPMNWQGNWAGQNTSYSKNDVVLDFPYLMIANKETTDRPGPVPQGEQDYFYAGLDPTTAASAKNLMFGTHYAPTSAYFVEGYRVYTITGNDYSIYTQLDNGQIELVLSFNASSTGWQELSITRKLIASGIVFRIIVVVSEPEPTLTEFTGNWYYNTPNNLGIPGSGEILHANQQSGILRIHKTDNDTTDRSADLATIQVGDQIDGPGISWSIQTVSDAGTYVELSVAPQLQGFPDGVFNFTFQVLEQTPFTYLKDVDYLLGNADVSGFEVIDGSVGDIVLDDNHYGVDILLQRVYLSSDWELMAIS